MRIFEMQPEHIPKLAELERICFSAPWSEEALYAELGHGLFLVAEINERIAGYIGCQIILDEGYITNIAIFPVWRRSGVASALLKALIERTGKILSFITLEVRASNLPAQRLYTKYQFIPVGTRPNFYRQPKEDAILMTRYFPKAFCVQYTQVNHPDFLKVVSQLDTFFYTRYGSDIAKDFNGIQALQGMECAVVAYAPDGMPIGCGCWKWHGKKIAEIKRIFVVPTYRRCGIAQLLFSYLTKDAAQKGADTTAIITGNDMQHAIDCYKKMGYVKTDFFPDMRPDAPCVVMQRKIEREPNEYFSN